MLLQVSWWEVSRSWVFVASQPKTSISPDKRVKFVAFMVYVYCFFFCFHSNENTFSFSCDEDFVICLE